MKRKGIIVIIVLAIIGGAVGGGWLYYRANPEAWDAFLADMNADSASSAPRPVSRPANRSGALVASGTIEAEEVTIASELGGRILEVLAGEGDEASAGELLMRMDQSGLMANREGAEAAVAQAEAGLNAARAQLARVRAGATPEEIDAAEAAVLAAQGAVMGAEAALAGAEISTQSARSMEQAESSVDMAQAALAQAEGGVEAAEADLARAEAERDRLLAGARPEEIAMYQGLLDQAHSQYLYMEDVHQELIENGIGGRPEERTRMQSDSARGARDAAQAQLNMVKAGASTAEIAAANAMVAAAVAQVSIAEAGVNMARAAMDQSQAGPETSQDQVSLADAGVLAAQAQVEIARGQLAQAEAQLAQMEAGPTAEEIAVLEAQVNQAEAALTSAEAALKALNIEIERTQLYAPGGGIVLQRLVHAGELAVPGAPLFVLADLDEVTLTVYVPEAELGRVALGQDVEVTVDAYDEVFMGQVSHIASEAEFTPRNVQTQEERVHMVFAVKVRLENGDHRLKPGMPADAVFNE